MSVIRSSKLISGCCLTVAGVALTAVPASAGPLVDPSTLTPPPPSGAVCRDSGGKTVCHTTLLLEPVNEATGIELPCGMLYDTGVDERRGIRWYNADGKLVKRFVLQDAEGTFTLSPTGAGPSVMYAAHQNWSNLYRIPGDESSSAQPTRGSFTVSSPGFGVIMHVAGIDLEDGHRGVLRTEVDPAVAAELCDALT